MDNILFKYFENRYNAPDKGSGKNEQFGPVITISRQTGCEAHVIASLVVEELNRNAKTKPWRFLDKEILEKSAKELNVSSEEIEDFYKNKDKSTLIDIVKAFSPTHINDLRIKNTCRDILLDVCKDGYLVFLGRAGAAILQDKPNTLNIRITAPFLWRIDALMRNRQMTIEQAEEYAIETDEQRHNLFYTFLGKQPGNLDYLFDATINRYGFSRLQVAQLIIHMAKMKGLKLE